MKKLALAVSILAISALSASAADLAARPYTKAPAMVESVYNWTGGYIGLNGGAIGTSNRWNDDNNWIGGTAETSLAITGGMPNVKSTSATFGAQAGYNWQLNGNIVFGIEGDINYAGNRSSVDRIDLLGADAYTFRNELSWYGTLRGRLGYAFDRTLVFVTGGLAYASLSHRSLDDGYEPLWNTNAGKFGYAIGGGIEHAWTQNWTIKAEALYMDFGTTTIAGDPTNEAAGFNASVKTTAIVGRVGMNYRFGGPVVARY